MAEEREEIGNLEKQFKKSRALWARLFISKIVFFVLLYCLLKLFNSRILLFNNYLYFLFFI